MDWQKNILMAGMLAVLFVLAIRWNTYQEKHPAVTSVATPHISSTPNSDIPVPIAATGAVDIHDATTPAVSTALIKIATDSLLVEINPLGGDIVKVSLPRHSADINTPDIPFVLIDNNSEHTYIAQSGLVGLNGTDTAEGRPLFSVEKTEYTLNDNQNTLVVDLTLQHFQVNIIKRYTFTRGQYLIGVEYIIDNQSSNKWSGSFFAQIKRDDKQFAKSNALAMSPFLGAAITTPTEKYKKITFKDMEENKVAPITQNGGWISMVQHYFISAWIPDANTTNTYNLRKMADKNLYLLGFTSNSVEIAPNSTSSIKASFYVGPKETVNLEKISPYLDLTVDYGWLWMIAKPLFWLLTHIHDYVGNWGLAIIGLTFAVKAIFFKLSATSYKSMAKMRKLAPKMLELKERYGDDRQKMSQETMKLYQSEKVNPLGGCLPMLIQMPVFLALYWVLMESVELRHAPFFFWIHDLSVLDPFFVLPVIYGFTMWFMQKLNPQPTDPMQARVMQLLPIVFTFMFLWFPAGLVLYWVTNNSLSMLQQFIITKQIENEDNKIRS